MPGWKRASGPDKPKSWRRYGAEPLRGRSFTGGRDLDKATNELLGAISDYCRRPQTIFELTGAERHRQHPRGRCGRA